MSHRIQSDVYGPALAALIASALAAAIGVAAFAVTTRPAISAEVKSLQLTPRQLGFEQKPRGGLVEVDPLADDAGQPSKLMPSRLRPSRLKPRAVDPNGNGVTYAAGAPQSCAPFAIQAKLDSIAAQCGAVAVISTHRPHARMRGTRRPSIHQHCGGDIGAADFRVHDYRCARRELGGWTGGQSTDPHRVGHLHISVGGYEGSFRHGRGKRAKR